MAEIKKIGNATVNDGKGLYDNIGLVETLIVDLNKLPKLLFDGQNIAFCDLIAKMGQKLGLLRKGIQADLDGRDSVIAELRDRLREAGFADDISAEEYMEKYGKKNCN